LQLGHLTNGEAVTGVTSSDLFSLCEERLGFLLPVEVIKRNTVKLSWLNNAFRELPDNETEVVISQHAHGHILTLIGSLLMPDTSASLVHLMYLPLLIDLNNVSNYNWGAVVLACLYRALPLGRLQPNKYWRLYVALAIMGMISNYLYYPHC